MPLCCPDNGICIVVNDNRNVLVTFLIAGLINANVYKVIKSSGALRFNVIQSSVYTTPNCFPVDAHIL